MDLATAKEIRDIRKTCGRAFDIRPARLFTMLCSWWRAGEDRAIVFEDVRFSVSLAQTQLWAGLRSVLWALPGSTPASFACCSTATLKKFATGDGSADKEAMRDSFRERWPGHDPIDDNAVDAVFLLHWFLNSNRLDAYANHPWKS
jgi:Holliday junction resolvasome RuvABC endonuclease subunit